MEVRYGVHAGTWQTRTRTRNSQNPMSSLAKKPPCLGVIYGNRDFFPDQLVSEARADLAKVYERAGVRTIQLSEKDSKLGGVETHADARKCAELVRRHAE